jgi:hypothetical protein
LEHSFVTFPNLYWVLSSHLDFYIYHPKLIEKRKPNFHAVEEDDMGSGNGRGSGAALPLNLRLPNRNMVAAAKYSAERKRLRGELAELDSFLKVSGLILTVLPLPIS